VGGHRTISRRVVAAVLTAATALVVPAVAGAAGPVSVTKVTPGGVALSATVHVTISGTGFDTGAAAVAVSGTGVSVAGVQVHGATTLTAAVTASAAAALGPRTLTVTIGGTQSGSRASAITVDPDPTLSAVAPAAIARTGRQQWLQLTGTNFEQGMTVSVTGATVASIPTLVDDPTTAIAPVTFPRNAALGPHRTVVANPDGGTGLDPTGPTVVAIPTATSISTHGVTEDETAVVTVAGSGFIPGAGATIRGGPGVAASVVSVAPSAIGVQLQVGSRTPVGRRTLIVIDGGVAVLTTVVRIGYQPILTRWAVGDGATSWTTTLARPVLATAPSIRFSGTGVTATVRLNRSHHAVVRFTVGRDAAPTWRTMTVTAGSDTWVVPRGLKVRLPPVITAFPKLRQRTANRVVVVKGKDFEVCPFTQPDLTVSGTGVTVNWANPALGFLMYVSVDVTAGAATGPRDVTMTNCDSGGTATSVGVLTVTS